MSDRKAGFGFAGFGLALFRAFAIVPPVAVALGVVATVNYRKFSFDNDLR